MESNLTVSMDSCSSATGKVLASELPKDGNRKCTVLYPASAKASGEIGMCNGSASMLCFDGCFGCSSACHIQSWHIVIFSLSSF